VSGSEPERSVIETLDGWAGRKVAVRVTLDARGELIAVFCGLLLERSEEKEPSVFWAIECFDQPPAERPGIYLHRGSLTAAQLHVGNFVLELQHGPVTTNVRLLDP
jgi:hypothetical protein